MPVLIWPPDPPSRCYLHYPRPFLLMAVGAYLVPRQRHDNETDASTVYLHPALPSSLALRQLARISPTA